MVNVYMVIKFSWFSLTVYLINVKDGILSLRAIELYCKWIYESIVYM